MSTPPPIDENYMLNIDALDNGKSMRSNKTNKSQFSDLQFGMMENGSMKIKAD